MPRNPNKIDYSQNFPAGLESFHVIEDPRSDGRTLHHFGEVLFLCVTGILCGMNGFSEISQFGRLQLDWLRKYGEFPNGAPSGQTLSNIFAVIDQKQFQDALITHIKQLKPDIQKQIIAIDGKALRGSHSTIKKIAHAVSAWAAKDGITLAQQFVDEKSNEITAIPKLLEMLDLEGHIVTIDAMGTQTDIAEQIIEKKGDYFLAVKGNQGSLLTAVEDHMHFGLTQINLEKSDSWDHYVAKEEKAHGRTTRRSVVVCNNLMGFDEEALKKWPGLQSIIAVETETLLHTKGKKRKPERRYYMSSMKTDAKTFHDISVKHWSIENQCHWVMDVTFREDYNRTRTESAPENFSTLVRMVLNILKSDETRKLSLPKKRLEALQDINYREKLLSLI